MSSSTSNQVLHPTNPVLIKDVNTPREKGQTRVLPDGRLLYREPLTDEEVPAVRLNDIRPRLVEEASNTKSYRFPKKRGYEDTNVTAFVKKDYNYGPKRENRPDCLFQIRSDGAKGKLPEGYVMDGDRIVLDAFDHGLRNFGGQLPIYVSSELEGQDIEHYLRRNWQIAVYDLVARAPNGYYQGKPETEGKKTKKGKKAMKWHAGPPRVGTFSMRATRFRLRVGLLSWEKKDGTVAKNQRILDLIPAEYKDQAVNSTKGWRDFNAADIKDIKAGAMKKPQQARKAKRAAQAEKDQEEKGDGVLEDGEEIEYEDEYSWTDAANEQDGSVWPEYNPKDFERTMPALQMYNANTQISNARQSSSDTYEASVNNENGPSRPNPKQPRKRSESFLDADSDEDISLRERKRRRIAAGAHYRGSEEGVSHHTKPSTVLRQQRPRPSPSPYAARVSSSRMAHPAVGNNILGQESLPATFGGEFDFSSPPSHQDLGQFYNSGSSVNARCLPSPDSHRNNGLRESVRFPLPSQLAQYDDYNVPQPRMQQSSPSDGYVQPSALLLDQVNSHSFGPDYLRNDINPDLGVWEENAEAYVPETDSYFNGYPEYESPVYEPQQIPSFEENQQTQHGAPVTLPMERAYLQSIPNAPKTVGKRKRTDDSTVENLEGQTRIKRAKGHTTEPAPAPEVWTPGDSPPGAEQFVPTTGLELPTPMYWPVDAQNTEFPQPESYSPDTIPSPFQTNQGDPWNGESFPLEEQGHLPPPVNIQQGMSERYATGPPDNYSYLQTPDHFYINQDAQYGPDEDAYPAVVFDPGQ